MNIKDLLFGSEQSTSPKGTLNWVDFKKTLRHLIVLASGTFLTIVFDGLVTYITGNDFGQYQFIVTLAINSGLLELTRRWLTQYLNK